MDGLFDECMGGNQWDKISDPGDRGDKHIPLQDKKKGKKKR